MVNLSIGGFFSTATTKEACGERAAYRSSGSRVWNGRPQLGLVSLSVADESNRRMCVYLHTRTDDNGCKGQKGAAMTATNDAGPCYVPWRLCELDRGFGEGMIQNTVYIIKV